MKTKVILTITLIILFALYVGLVTVMLNLPSEWLTQGTSFFAMVWETIKINWLGLLIVFVLSLALGCMFAWFTSI